MKEVKPSKKPLAIYYAIVLLVLLLINFVLMPWLAERQVQEVDYGTFMDMAENHELGQVEVDQQENQIIFRTKEEVEAMIEADELLEYAQYVENYYGTPRSYVEEMLSKGKNVILEIEIQGAMKVKEKIPEALLVFVTPPTVAELEKRLKGRGTETDQVIADRLARAGEEAKGMDQYDYILVNDDVEECVDHLHDIIVSEHSRASRNIDFIEDIQRQTKAFQK